MGLLMLVALASGRHATAPSSNDPSSPHCPGRVQRADRPMGLAQSETHTRRPLRRRVRLAIPATTKRTSSQFCLTDLSEVTCPSDRLEVWIVADRCTDDTAKSMKIGEQELPNDPQDSSGTA